jgi:hypothetical protein
VSINRTRAILLGFLALMAMGSITASAIAEPGPFWHQRAKGAKGEGKKIEENPGLLVNGEGGPATLTGEPVLGTKAEIQAKITIVHLQIYNNPDQGQFKFRITYVDPQLLKPALKPCEVKVGKNNEVNVEGHLVWKWNGTAEQLAEKPQLKQKIDGLAIPVTTKIEGVKEIPKEEYTPITLSGSGCGVLAGTFKVSNTEAVEFAPAVLEEFRTQLTASSHPGEFKQHFYNQKEQIGITTGLMLGGQPANLSQEDKVEPESEEVAIFEK